MDNVRRNKRRGFWSLFNGSSLTNMASKLFQTPIRDGEKATNRPAKGRIRSSKETIGSFAENLRSVESAVAKGAGTRQGIRALQEDIVVTCNALLKHT